MKGTCGEVAVKIDRSITLTLMSPEVDQVNCSTLQCKCK